MTTTALVTDASKFGKLLRLALIANADGEVLGAIAALKRALASAGLGPHDICDAFERGAQPIALQADDRRQHDDRHNPEIYHSDIWFAFHHRRALSGREAAFIESLTRWRSPLSEKQITWLMAIVDRLRGEDA
jgi:hypothetical protein